MVNTRIQQARKAYQKGDLQKTQLAHTKKAISASFAHSEIHKRDFDLSDIILGSQDGIVNVLGVILGVVAASASQRIVIAAGLAAAFAESVSMAAVAYTSTLSEADHYLAEVKREKWEIENIPEGEKEEIRQLYKKRGFKGKLLNQVVETIISDKQVWLEVMLSEELKLKPLSRQTALRSVLIVGTSAILGSLIPLMPFFFFSIKISVVVSLLTAGITLFAIGFYKAKITVGKPFKSGIEIAVIGLISALIGYLIGSLFKT